MTTATKTKTDSEWEPRIVAFCCNWCSYAGADLAGTSRIQYPPNARIIRVNCTGRIDTEFILSALNQGADGVLVSGCHPGDCHYTSGNLKLRARWAVMAEAVKQAGIDPRRIRLQWASASEAQIFADGVTKLIEQVKEALRELQVGYETNKDSSLLILNEADQWKLTTREEYGHVVRKVVSETELTKSQLETLAVIAFKYPIKQSDLIKIRTNKAYDHIMELEKTGFISRQKYGRSRLLKLTDK